MSTKKSLLALAAMALALMGFASSAMAGTGKVEDIFGGVIGAGEEIHFVGWAKFATPNASYECHVTAKMTTTGGEGKTAHVNVFRIPATVNCIGEKLLNGCTLVSHSNNTEGALHWDVTATSTDFDVLPVTGQANIDVFNHYSGCLVTKATVTFDSLTLKPLKTNTGMTTGTANRVHQTTAATGVNADPIAGVEISGSGTADITDIFGGTITEPAAATGELEISEIDRRCTYKLVAA